MESHGRGSGPAVVVLALVFATSLVLITGCGGGDGAATGGTRPERVKSLSRAELIARADAVCVWSQRALRKAAIKFYKDIRFENPTERLPWVPYSEVVVAIAKKTVRELKELEPPRALRAAFAAYIDAEEEVEKLAEQAFDAAVEDNDAPYYRARKTRDAGVLERDDLARAVGLKKCSPNPFTAR